MNNVLPPTRGTDLKFCVTADLGNNIHLDDVDFKCRFFRSGLNNGQTVEKKDMARISADEYLAVVDTKVIGSGEYYMVFSAKIPDGDVPDGFRDEVVTVPTGINVK